MSHVTVSNAIIMDLAILKKTLDRFPGLELIENAGEHKSYAGSHEKCVHAIKVKGSNFEIGLYADKDGGYRLGWDHYGSDGQAIDKLIGRDGEKLLCAYAETEIREWAWTKGYTIQESIQGDEKHFELIAI